tara:strand:- start:103 stop:318 length:216 start_codon:yes stop_codon:yes gene_type:complete
MIKEPEKPFEKIQYVWTEDYTNVLIADISIIIFLLILCWRWKEQRTLMLVGTALYSFFTVMWHFPPGLLTY